MNTVFVALSVLSAIAIAVGMLMEFSRVLMMLQQNSYRNERYMRWLQTSADTTSFIRLLAMIVFFASLVRFSNFMVGSVLVLIYGLYLTISLKRAKYKKPLVWTKRARRIYGVMVAIVLVVTVAVAVLQPAYGIIEMCSAVSLTLLVAYVVSSAVVLTANTLLAPVERAINRHYYNDAASILSAMPQLKVIGITGSYGKTSTKHYLNRILSEHFDVVMTPGSFNTTLGVVRTVREYLKPYNEVFIVEMGAKQPGDIKEICDLVHPSIGIVTAVGEQHLESFHTIENVQRTKFELVDALPSDGLAVLNNDFPYVANRDVTNVASYRYAISSNGETAVNDYTVKDVSYGATGTQFTVVGPNCQLTLHTRLVGECNISNLMAAVIVAKYLQVPDEKILYAVEKIEQVEHRLNLKRTPGGVTIIDDAFNSNPTGSGMALDVLSAMKGGRRIVVTPGMIELGDRQEFHNHVFGQKIADSADIAIIVGRYNRQAIVDGIKERGTMNSDAIHIVDSFAQAQQLLGSILRSGDTILYENDLPDTFK
jgi:UDP-N-acetylmuramoyl-tripeptide--D-alanyl-D-alanine ligase